MINAGTDSKLQPIKLGSGADSLKLQGYQATESARRVYLHAGQVHVSTDKCELVTIVGSCVSVLLWDTKQQIGGGAHFLLPMYEGEGEATARYGNVAMQMLIDGLRQRGVKTSDVVAHVYGGASVLMSLHTMCDNLGVRNVEQAVAILNAAGIRVVKNITGGAKGRKVVFRTADGTANLEEIS